MNKILAIMFLLLAMYILNTYGINFLTWQWWVIVVCWTLHDILWRD